MYHQYFGLEEAPFSIAVNPRYLYMSPRHRDALAHLLYGVGAGGGFILLTGEVGTGKTTINRCLLEQLPEQADVAVVLNPALDARDLLATACEELGLAFPDATPGLKDLTDALHRFLLENHQAGRKTVLMIDEAQHLGFDVLEQIRLLTNLETNEEKLLHIILIGQPELADKLARPELRQLNQRITARFDLRPLTVAETGAYIRHRLHVAGMPAGRNLFSDRLVRAVHRESGGIPRLINLLCDRMLLGAYGQGLSSLDAALLRQAAKEVTGADRRRSGSHTGALIAAGLAACALLGVASWTLFFQPDAPAVLTPAQTPMPAEETVVPSSAASAEAPLAEPPGPSPEGVPLPASEESSAVDTSWRLSFVESSRILQRLYEVPFSETGEDPCIQVREPRLRCEGRDGGTWNELVAEDRPVVLRLVDERRFESRAIFLGLAEDAAILATGDGLRQVSPGVIAQLWTGEYWWLWRVPEQFGRTLQLGDQGEDVRYLGRLFANLDGQSEPLSESRFDARLEQRLTIFQEAHGLNADGVLGEETLRVLSIAAGFDLSNESARARLEIDARPGAGALVLDGF